VTDLREQLQSGLADRYRLKRELGRGGMATVYLAYDVKHDRRVALKVLRPELAATLGPERFQREIRLAARLQHPHILPVHDSGEAAGQLWYTMPFVEGESLRDRLRRERELPLDEALRIAREVAEALGYAHVQGIVHRDIKPENILLSQGHALVADFGLARAFEGREQELTSSGMLVGTPPYMSPEQSRGSERVDGRSDLYSLGCVLYEMLTGEPPYMGTTPQAIMAKRFMDPVPSSRRLRETVPEALDQALQRVLAKVPADRFSTAAEFARALGTPNTTPVVTPVRTSSTVSASPSRSEPALRRGWWVAGALAALGLVGLGMRFAWRTSPEAETSGVKRLAVLPFDNLGDSADAYFADGVANDLRAKLSQIAGLAVIARGSSNEYKGSTKTQQQIARELGVDYLLTATIQWEKGAEGVSRVRVAPELVDVRPGHAPQTRWGEPFDAAMTDVFQVQADIAGEVAQALNVALGDSAKHELASKPTQSLPAYEAFLRGEASSQGMLAEPSSLRQAIAAYEKAIALDSSFVRAWAQLARARATLYWAAPTPELAEATRRAAEQALALAPSSPDGHEALGAYYLIVPKDYPRALTEDSTGLAVASGNAELLGQAATAETFLGRWEAARGHLEQAARLDPRSSFTAQVLGRVLLYTRRYPEAERALDHALQLMPANLLIRCTRVMVALAQGDFAGAQAVLRAAPKAVDPTTLVQFMATKDLMWMLDDAQQRLLLRLTPSAFDNDRADWAGSLAQTYAFRGDRAMARAYADSARLAYEQRLRATPQDASLHAFLGLNLAYLGQKAAAIREGKRAVGLLPISRHALEGALLQHYLARLYVVVGEPELALDQLEPLLKVPYYLSPGWLKIDPNFAPLSGNPRFERLVNGP
jgi:serine/threonine protein kinase/Flp pilus assembly protein TadD